jgi:hypothetical protein
MVCIHHAGDPIESIPVKLILFGPKPQIAQQKPQYFMGAVIEKSAIPQLVATLATFVKVKVVGSVKFIQAV